MKLLICILLLCQIGGCASKLHTNLSKSDMTAVLQSTFEIGMPESEVLSRIDDLGMEAQYETSWYQSWTPAIAVVVPDDRPHFIYPYGIGMLGIELDSELRTLTSIEYVTLTHPREERDWWPTHPVMLMGEPE